MVAGTPSGRQEESAQLRSVADSVISSSTAALAVVTGEAGIGKTTLVDVFVDHLRSTGFTVLRTSGSAAEAPLTWAGLHALLHDAARRNVADLPEPQSEAVRSALGLANTALDPGLVAAGVAGTIRTLAAESPVAIIIDDLHWLDAATAGVTAFAVRATSDLPVLTVLAHRPQVPVPLDGERLLAVDRITKISLGGLSAAGVHRVVFESSGIALRRPDLIRLRELTGGNPLFTVEVSRLMATGASMDQALRAPTLQETIAIRIAALPDATRRVLEAVALLASPTVDVVGAALPDGSVDAVLVDAEDAGVVAVRGRDIHFTHPLLRAAVLDRLGGVRRLALTRALSDLVTDADERAVLLGAATLTPDETIAIALTEAGERAAAKGVLGLATERFQRAVELTSDPAARFTRLMRLARTTIDNGDARGAIAPAEEAARLAENPAEATDASIVAVEAIANSHGLQAAEDRANELLERIAGHVALEARTLELIGRVQLFNDLRAADQTVARAVVAAQQSGDAALVTATTILQGVVHFLRGLPVDLDPLRDIATGPNASKGAKHRLLELLTWSDLVGEGIPLARRNLADAEARGHQIDGFNARDQLADCLWRAGQWNDAIAERRWCNELGMVLDCKYQGNAYEADNAVTFAALGDHAEAERLLASSLDDPSRVGIQQVQCDSKAGFVMLAQQRWAEAAEWLRSARTSAAIMAYEDLGGIAFRADLVEALVHLGEIDEARDVAQEHRRLAERSRLTRGLAESSRGAGLVLAAQGDHAGALGHLEEALGHHERMEVPFEHARTLLALGGVLRRAGRRAQAAERLGQADEIFASLGSKPWQARVADERQRLGTKRVDALTLTATELRVAELAVGGRTNVEIAAELVVSLRTVESNLTRVYRKLGVRSRTEMASKLATRI